MQMHPLATPESRPDSFHTAHSANSRRTGSSLASSVDGESLAVMLADLDIDPNEEDEFGWIAEVALKTAMPPRWAARYDGENGATYFVDTDTQTSTWDNPLVPHLAKVVDIGRMHLRNPSEGLFEDQKRILWSHHRAELECWHGPVPDGDGNNYFVNSKVGVSSWQDPRMGAQYIFDVQCSLLRHLEQILAVEDHDASGGFLEGGTPWENEDGAQVFTLEGNTPVSRSVSGNKLARLGTPGTLGTSGINRALQRPEDHTFTLRQMTNAADWLHDARQNEEEIQRLRLIRKVEERRMRKLSRKLSKAIHETVQGEEDAQRDQRHQLEQKLLERRANRAPLAPLPVGARRLGML